MRLRASQSDMKLPALLFAFCYPEIPFLAFALAPCIKAIEFQDLQTSTDLSNYFLATTKLSYLSRFDSVFKAETGHSRFAFPYRSFKSSYFPHKIQPHTYSIMTNELSKQLEGTHIR
jgi:hypothetical protein